MKGLVVYNGKYGSTERYANWIGESLGIPVRAAKEVGNEELAAADYLVLGSSVQVGKLTIAGKLKRWWPIIASKRVLFFTTSGTPPSEREELERILTASLPQRLPNHSYHPAGGRIDYSNYSPIMRLIMTGVAKSEFKERHPGEPLPADLGTRTIDAVDRSWIEPLIAEAKALK
jgi:menaquinone-dependent protoporphyrinogen IX oxidase